MEYISGESKMKSDMQKLSELKMVRNSEKKKVKEKILIFTLWVWNRHPTGSLVTLGYATRFDVQAREDDVCEMVYKACCP